MEKQQKTNKQTKTKQKTKTHLSYNFQSSLCYLPYRYFLIQPFALPAEITRGTDPSSLFFSAVVTWANVIPLFMHQ